MKIWAFISQKGGSGKSTLATQIAVYATQIGERVLILDLDPQASSFAWQQARGEGSSPGVVRSLPHNLPKVLEACRELDITLVIIDTAPHSDSGVIEAIKATDLIICPSRPSLFDIGAMRDTVQMINLADSLGRAVGVLNAVHAQGAVKTYGKASTLLERFGIRVAATYIVDRIAYQNAVDEGKGVTELKDPKAASEIQRLWSELNETWPVIVADQSQEHA